MTIRMTRRRVLEGAALLAGGTALPGLGGRAVAQGVETHGLSTFGELGLPADLPSLGELTQQAKQNLQAPWLGFTAFASLALMLSGKSIIRKPRCNSAALWP